MKEDNIRVLGHIAIFGGLLNIVADLIVVSRPIPPDNKGIAFLAIMPIENVRIGVVLGFFALTSWLLAVPSLSAGLARASAIERGLASTSFALFVAGCLVFHCLFWPITIAIQATTGSESEERVLRDIGEMLGLLTSVIMASLVVLTVVLVSAVFQKRADYPRWLLLLSPVVTAPTLGKTSRLFPPPYAGYVAAVTLTALGTLFVAGLVLARRRAAQQGSGNKATHTET